jgi:DNA polymerase I-like protein with 3'-5' exonuclease and polymerase domains
MRVLPLYPSPPSVFQGSYRAFDHSCASCSMHQTTRAVCLTPTGTPGGLLVIRGEPDRTDHAARAIMPHTERSIIGKGIKAWWRGPVAQDTVLRCYPGSEEVKEKHLKACGEYMSTALELMRPTRILLLGGAAFYAALGRRPRSEHVRKGWTWWCNGDGDNVPVFYLPSLRQVSTNTFAQRRFEKDLEWALRVPDPDRTRYEDFTYLVETVEDAEAARAALAGKLLVSDTETEGRQHDLDFRICSVTFKARGGDSYSFDEALHDPAILAIAVSILRDAPGVGGHNLKYDAISFMVDPRWAVDITAKMAWDTRIDRRVLDGEADGTLENAAETVGMGGHKREAQDALEDIKADLKALANAPHRAPLKSGKPRGPVELRVLTPDQVARLEAADVPARIHAGEVEPFNYAYGLLPSELRARYCARDTAATDYVRADTEPRVGRFEVALEKIIRPAAKALARMETRGVAIDKPFLRSFIGMLDVEVARVQGELGSFAPSVDFNWNSPPQLRKLLFDDLKLPASKRTDSGLLSTSKDVLDELAPLHPVAAKLKSFRELTKLRSTYGIGLLHAVREDGRVHTSYLIDGAGTGRLSSQDPNLQNIPIRTELGRKVRHAFCTRPGWLITEADYSQLELRIAAIISGDQKMIARFAAGEDFHLQTARDIVGPRVHGVSPEAFTHLPEEKRKAMRDIAKAVNFAVHYGKTAPSLADDLGISVSEAQSVLDAILGEFNVLRSVIAQTLIDAQQTGGVWTTYKGQNARWRPLMGLGETGSGARGIVSNAENAAWNTRVQGSGANCTNAALGAIEDAFEAEGLETRLILTVHDSIACEGPHYEAREAREIMRQVMSSQADGPVELVVDFKEGTTWGSAKAVDHASA